MAAALRVLVEGGQQALTVRRVAAEAGVSTIGVYTWFGGKDGLIDAIWIEGFQSFAAAIRSAHRDAPPVEQLVAQARAYRAWALAHPVHYRVLFLGAVPSHIPGHDAIKAGAVAFELLQEAVTHAVDQRAIVSTDVDATAMFLWGLVHGMVSLQLVNDRPVQLATSDQLDDRAFDTAIEAVVRGMTP